MKQTAVEWLDEQLQIMDSKSYNNLIQIEMGRNNYKEIIEQAKEMEKEQMIEAINTVSENNVKYANMIISSWSQIEGELFMHNTKLAKQYYNETFKNTEQ